MKKLLTISVLLITKSAFAGVFSDAKLEDLAKKYGRAEISITKSAGKVNVGKLINKLKADHTSESCGDAEIESGRKNAIDSLKNFYEEYTLAEKLLEMKNKNLIKVGLVARDGSEGDSEYCSTSTFQFISIDGEILTIYFDFNT